MLGHVVQNSFDTVASDGLSATSDSIGYKITEVERHFHSYERWLGAAVTPSGETNIADPIGTSTSAFQIDAENDDWGSWVQIIGSADTPVISGSTHFDLHRLLFTATERNAVYFVQVGAGASGAAALSAGTYTEAVFLPSSNLVDSGPVDINIRRQTATTKVWARTYCPGQNTATIDFYVGLHEYEG